MVVGLTPAFVSLLFGFAFGLGSGLLLSVLVLGFSSGLAFFVGLLGCHDVHYGGSGGC